MFADRALADWVTMIASSGGELDVQAMRAATAERARTRARGPEMDSVQDVAVGDLRARLYRPGKAALPVVLVSARRRLDDRQHQDPRPAVPASV